MPYWGIARRSDPNSRYSRMPDDPQGAGLAAISLIDRVDRATPIEPKLIRAMHVLYDAEHSGSRERDQALAAMRSLNRNIPTILISQPICRELYVDSALGLLG